MGTHKEEEENMRSSRRQLKAMLRKNWLLKIRHPFITCAEILLPTVVMLLLIAVRTRVDTQIHPPQPYIRKEMFVEVGKGSTSPTFNQFLQLLSAKGEYLAFAPDTHETRMMINSLSLKFPLLKLASRVYKDEEELETYIRSDLYSAYDKVKNSTNPKIKGAIVFHDQGHQSFDYSIRLNHTWAFSGFPDVKSIMDMNGPYLNDLELGVNTIPIMQYGFSGFLTLQQVMDSFIIYAAQQRRTDLVTEDVGSPSNVSGIHSQLKTPWTKFTPANIRLAPFPTREYTDDEFQSIVKKVMGVLYLLGFLYPISRLISYSVLEKELKIKEGLYMMGLKDEIFHFSWFITYALQFAISSGIITLCTMGTLFKYSDKSLVFMYFFSFGLSSIMLSFLISTFFTRAKTAVTVGTLSFLGAFFPYYTINDEAVSMVLKVMASFLSPTAFALGSVNFADYERAHVGLRWSNIWRDSSGVNFLVCLLMMLLDTFLYCVIGLFLDKVLHKENGYPWNFMFCKCFRRKKRTSEQYASSSQVASGHSEENASLFQKDAYKPAVEVTSLEMKQQELDGRCIQMRNLHKVYTTKKRNCCAVNSLQLTLYENQILALLGHNGAGKSTTISMLVGLLPPTSGDALVFGKNISTDMDEIRKSLGVCPQYDILFPELTVKEHLEIFANIKGVNEDYLENVVAEMAEEVGLADKVNTVVKALSGGMRRKLSLGIALIGNSKVVILDEPTSGMDPYSMRLTWQLIKKIKKGRIILLTTHSMDEAEVLGDRIAIMANGSLKCCGSSLFLKHQYGVGYTLTLVKATPSASVAADIVYRHIPTATCVSEVGTEISFKLPLASSASFESMFREIECCMQRADPSFESPGYGDNISLGIESFGISVTTLEEVFLRVAGGDFDETECSNEKKSLVSPDNVHQPCQNIAPKTTFHPKLCRSYFEVIGLIFSVIGKACSLFFATVLNVIKFLSMQCCCSCIFSRSTFWKHSKALLIKRAISARRDRKTIVFQLLIPAIFLLLGLVFLKLKPHPDQQSVTLTTSFFNPLLTGGGGGGPIPFDLSLPIANEIAEHVHGGWIQRFRQTTYRFPNSQKALEDAIEAAGSTLGPILLSMSEYLMSSNNESYQSRYGAIVMDNQSEDGSLGYTVLHNCSCQHAAPTFINIIDSAMLRLATLDENMTIKTRNHPLPMTESQRQQHHDLDAFSAAVVVNIAFSFIPASYAVAIVKEREVKAKHQQLISGVSILSYWTSTYLWDFISFLLPSSFAIVLFSIFGLDQFIGGDSFFPTVLMFLEYGLAIASSTYCLTFFFSEHSMAQNVVLLVHLFTGLILMVISFIMGLIKSTAHANSLLKNFFRLSPGFCFADGLASLALLRQGMKTGSDNSVFDWNVTGASICYLAAEGIVYFILTLGLELLPLHKINFATACELWTSSKKLFLATSGSSSETLLASSLEDVALDHEDRDVQTERDRVLSGSGGNALIYLHNLRKVYPGGKQNGSKVAVHSLTFSVQEGECFGFLGTNGAGKTTTLSMLSGEERPSDGTAFIFGKDIRLNPKAARRHIGYCPQFDALLEFLTVREHLDLYARIKGVPEYELEYVVMEKLVEFDLMKHANKPSYALSGGNKRKLSVAIAMIGDPPIVILDEPSTAQFQSQQTWFHHSIAHNPLIPFNTHQMNQLIPQKQTVCRHHHTQPAGLLVHVPTRRPSLPTVGVESPHPMPPPNHTTSQISDLMPQSTDLVPLVSTELQLPNSNQSSQPLSSSTPAAIEPPPSQQHPMVTRSRDGTLSQKIYSDGTVRYPLPRALLHCIDTVEPTCYTQAAKQEVWRAAMADEINALLKNQTWTLVPPSPSQNTVGCKWVFRVKHNPDGTVEWHKARLFAKGFHQQQGIDYDETFSPVIKPATIRTVLSLAVSRGWSFRQLDVKNAFLHGYLKEDVHMVQPPGFIDQTKPSYVCKLNKAIYGLKQAPRAWFQRMTSFLLSVGFVQSVADSSLFIFQHGPNIIYFLLYVDDIVVTGSNDKLLQSFIDALGRGFDIKDLGTLHYFLGLQVISFNGNIHISQIRYAHDLLQKHDMLLSKPVGTPMSAKISLSASEGDILQNPTVFREIIGSMQYLTITRPDIAFAVNSISQFMSQPRQPHLVAAKRILRYIKGTLDYGLVFGPQRHPTHVAAYADADWAGCPETRRSTSGYLVYLGTNLVSWCSKKQSTIARSSAEAEYRSLSHASAETTWLAFLLYELGAHLQFSILLHCDNLSATYMASNPVFHARTKHIELDYHFVREKVALGSHRVCFIPSVDQPADLLTKPLHKHRHASLASKLVRAGPPSLREGSTKPADH